jgi:hypothetical protein
MSAPTEIAYKERTMSSPFAITAATNTVFLESNRQGQTSFTVSNTTAHAVRGRAHLVAQQTSAASWLTFQGDAEREFVSSGSHQYVVQITLPPGAPAGDYTFRLDMVDLANPDDDFSEGPVVKFVVTPSVPVKKPFPWWIVAVVVGLLILVGGATYSIIRLSHNQPTVTVTKLTPTRVLPTPTPTPKPVFVGPWQGQFTFNTGQNSAQSLQLSTLQNGAFMGTLFGHGFGEGPSSTNVSGMEGSLNSFGFNAQNRLQQAINQNGNGAGIYVEFTAISYGTVPGIFPLNSVFDAVVYADGSLHGVWFNPGDTQPNGTFTLNKSS